VSAKSETLFDNAPLLMKQPGQEKSPGVRRVEAGHEGVISACEVMASLISVGEPVATRGFPAAGAFFGGWSRKVWLPVAARPDHQVVGPPLFFGEFHEAGGLGGCRAVCRLACLPRNGASMARPVFSSLLADIFNTWANRVESRPVFRFEPNCWPRILWQLVLVLIGLVACDVGFAQDAKPKAGEGTAPAAAAVEPESAPAVEESAESDELPLLESLPLPELVDLLKGPPVDWLVLRSKRVLVVEPVSPRPGLLEAIERRLEQAIKNPETAGNSLDAQAKRKALQYVPLVLAGEDDEDLRIQYKLIGEVIYWDDLMLRRVDRLLDEKQLPEALALWVATHDRAPAWPGLEERYQRLLFVDGEGKRDQGRPEEALALFDELYGRNSKYPDLDTRYGQVIRGEVDRAVTEGDFRRARYFLGRLTARYPSHPVAAQIVSQLSSRAAGLIRDAQSAPPDAALDAMELAARVWPTTPSLFGPYQRAHQQWTRVSVGRITPSAQRSSPWPILDQGLDASLEWEPWFAPGSWTEGTTRFESRWFREWEPTELGRSLLFTLRDERGRQFTAGGIARRLAATVDPKSPDYSVRLAGTIDRLEVTSPNTLQLDLLSVPLKPEALLATLPAPNRREAAGAAAGDGVSSLRRFRPAPTEVSGVWSARYRRSAANTTGGGSRPPVEVLFRDYPTADRAIQSFLRGEVTMLSRIPVSTVREFQKRTDVLTLAYGLPETHLLQFSATSSAVANRALRRALMYAVPRDRILAEAFGVAREPGLARLTTGVVPTTSYAFDKSLVLPPTDLVVALSLAIAAKKELGGPLPELTLWHPRGAEIAASAAAIAATWDKIGVRVTVRSEAEQPDPGSSDVVYRTVAMAEPLVELWPFLSGTADPTLSSLDRFPVWLRRSLLELDTVGDMATATRLLHRLQRQLWAEAVVIPLWEIQPHFVTRKQVRGLPAAPMTLFQGIDRWQVDAWYPPE
jgi:hypothetical protein